MSDQENDDQKKEFEEYAATTVEQLENGIFSLVITMVKRLSAGYPREVARTYVAAYLDGLADGLRKIDDEEQQDDDGST